MKKRRKHTPEQIVMKLRDADVMLNSGKDVAAVLHGVLPKNWSVCYESLGTLELAPNFGPIPMLVFQGRGQAG